MTVKRITQIFGVCHVTVVNWNEMLNKKDWITQYTQKNRALRVITEDGLIKVLQEKPYIRQYELVEHFGVSRVTINKYIKAILEN